MHEARVGAEGAGVDGQDRVILLHPVEPAFNLRRLGGVSLARLLDARLYLADGDGADVNVRLRQGAQPSDDGAVRLGAAQFRDDVGVEPPVPRLPNAVLFR
jgi:hypothetical protein